MFFYIYFNKMSKCLNFYISKFLTIKIILKQEKKLIFNMHLDRLISFVCNEEKKKKKNPLYLE